MNLWVSQVVDTDAIGPDSGPKPGSYEYRKLEKLALFDICNSVIIDKINEKYPHLNKHVVEMQDVGNYN